MQSSIKSEKHIDIKEFYSMNISALWKGLKQEHISFWFLCFYFLFEYVRPQTLYPMIDILPWAQSFLILTILTSLTNKSIVWVSNPLNKLFILFALIIVLSGIFAINPEASWDLKEAMLGWLIVYFLVINIVNTEKLVILFIVAYMLFNLKMAQHGAISWASRGFSFASYGLIGSPGWFRNSGEYAIQMIIYGSLAFAFVYALKDYWGKYKKMFLYVVAATGYLAVIGASSRGAQVAMLGIVVWFMLKQKNGFKGLILLGIASVVLYQLLPDEQLQRFSTVGEDATSLQRLAYWEIGFKISNEHPLLGIGYNNWISYLNHLYPEGVGPLNKIELAHNIYIQASAELGYLGLSVFLLMALYSFSLNCKTRQIARDLDNKLFFNLSLGLDAGLIGYLIAGSFVSVFYYPFFWIQIAMIVMLNSVTKKQCEARPI